MVRVETEAEHLLILRVSVVLYSGKPSDLQYPAMV